MKKAVVLLVLVALILGAVVFGKRLITIERPQRGRPNILLFSLDTLRADRLGTYGYSRATSPFLDSLAAQGTIFENAVAPAPWTLPSHVSLFTGMYPSSHGVTLAKGQRIGDQTELFAEILKRHGYQNYAYVAGGYLGKRFGFPRGFETYYANSTERDRESEGFAKVLKMAHQKLLSLKEDPAPDFMFLHTYTVHCPYSPPEPYASMFKSEGAETINTNHCGKVFNAMPDFNSQKALFISDRYDGSVRFLDTLLKDFFEKLKADNLLENTIVVIISDHGDSFYEHGEIGHGRSLHRELLMIPMIFVGPGIEARRISEPVSLVDVFPTILEALSLPVAAQNQGRSLLPLLRGEREKPAELVFSELDHDALLRSLINPLSDHFILNLETDEAKFYDLVSDPTEQRNLAASIPDQILGRKSMIKKIMQGFRRFEAGPVDSATQEHLEQLETLGYL